MSAEELQSTVIALTAAGKGILAADESTGTIGKRLASIGVDNVEPMRLAYRSTLFTTPGLAEFISGVILYDETLRQKDASGVPLAKILADAGMVPGIKVDTGAKPMALRNGETVTEGLDGLRDRLAEYKTLGARFAKWRAVISIADGRPSRACLEANAHALARYAALCQEAGIVPIVEPEVLMDGDHDQARCERVTSAALRRVFDALNRQGVALEHILLKPNMVVSGKSCATQATVAEVAEATLRTFRRVVPAAVPGIVFLSGGQSDEKATEHLNAMNATGELPWVVSFSYGRALQAPALSAWAGKEANREAAQKALYHRARCNGAAQRGKYTAQLEQS